MASDKSSNITIPQTLKNIATIGMGTIGVKLWSNNKEKIQEKLHDFKEKIADIIEEKKRDLDNSIGS